MASASQSNHERLSSAIKMPCATCSKPIGIVRCEGCQALFCRNDLNEHRNQLAKRLEELTVEHDAFRETMTNTTTDPRTHELIRRIDAWEKEAKMKIKQAAEEARRKIETQAKINGEQISVRFRELTERLRQEQKDDTYDERDLKRWTEQLTQLVENFKSPSFIAIEDEPGNFIAKVIVKDLEALGKRFNQVAGNAQISEEGLVVSSTYNNHNNWIAQIRGKGEYSGGIHNIRVKIEQYSNSLLFFGVNSKSTPLNTVNPNGVSCYGWVAGPNNMVYKCGQAVNNYSEYTSDFKTNDTIELELDCYRRLIRVRNHRSNKQYELLIDIEKCPYPWMFQFGLSTIGDRLRIIGWAMQ